MAHYRVTASSGQPFNMSENNAYNSVSGSWTRMGEAVSNRPVRVQGVYWTATTPGSILTIRDILRNHNGTESVGAIWYEAQCMGGTASVDLFPSHLTLFSPFEYFDTEGSCTIIIYGEYI